ncbi:MAG: hypothetical protein ABI707_13760 [Ferruginibacter sp.]
MSLVKIYEHADRKGKKLEINLDELTLNQVYSLEKQGMDNVMSSLKWEIAEGFKLIIYEAAEGQGRQFGFSGNGIDNNTKLNRDFNDKASSYRFIRNNSVPEYFGVISPKPAVIKFNSEGSIHGTDGWSAEEHYQGVQVINENYIMISTSDFSGAYFFIVKWENGILAGKLGRVQKQVKMNNDFAGMKFNHPGGMQLLGNIIAIPVEYIGDTESPGSRSCIVFYDISDPKDPKKISLKIDRQTKTSSAVGLTHYEDRILLVAGGTDTKQLDFYESRPGETSIGNSTVFSHVKTWNSNEADKSRWLNNVWGKYQGLNLIRDVDGKIYLIGVRPSTPAELLAGGYSNCIDLFSVDIRAAGTKNILKKISKKMVHCENGTSQEFGSGVYISGRRLHYIVTGSGRSNKQDDNSTMVLNYFS